MTLGSISLPRRCSSTVRGFLERCLMPKPGAAVPKALGSFLEVGFGAGAETLHHTSFGGPKFPETEPRTPLSFLCTPAVPVGGTSLPNAEPATQTEPQGADADRFSHHESLSSQEICQEALQGAARLSSAGTFHSYIIRAIAARAASHTCGLGRAGHPGTGRRQR